MDGGNGRIKRVDWFNSCWINRCWLYKHLFTGNYNFIDITPRDYAWIVWKECPWYIKCLYIILTPLFLTLGTLTNRCAHLWIVQLYAVLKGGLYGYSCDILMHCGKRINKGMSRYRYFRFSEIKLSSQIWYFAKLA